MPGIEQAARDLFVAQYRDTVYSLKQFWRFNARHGGDGGGAWQLVPLETVRAELVVIVERLGSFPSARVLASLLDHLRLRLARPVLGWNQSPSLIPCRNGVLHLDTRQLAPHEPRQYLARSLPVAYDPSALAPAWHAFLAATVPAAAGFLQEFAGLALTFDTRYETAVWLYGPPGSGKSTFLIGLQAMLGDRAGQLDLLNLARRQVPAADLFGRSLLLSAEQPLRDLEHDNLLNALISGEPLAVHGPFRQADALSLHAKWIWAMVSLPRLNRHTSGLYRRVQVVPFPPRAEADRDPGLKERIALEGSGILNWSLAGLARLNQRGRFAPPPSVTAASLRFARANDLVAQFVADACHLDPASRESGGDLYQSYVAWCRRSGLRPESATALAVEWERLGLERRRITGRTYWLGLRFRSTRPPQGPSASDRLAGDPPEGDDTSTPSAMPLEAATPAIPATPATPATSAMPAGPLVSSLDASGSPPASPGSDDAAQTSTSVEQPIRPSTNDPAWLDRPIDQLTC